MTEAGLSEFPWDFPESKAGFKQAVMTGRCVYWRFISYIYWCVYWCVLYNLIYGVAFIFILSLIVETHLNSSMRSIQIWFIF